MFALAVATRRIFLRICLDKNGFGNQDPETKTNDEKDYFIGNEYSPRYADAC